MAIVKMQKLRVIGLKSRSAEIMDALAKSGNFEVITPDHSIAPSESVDKLLVKKARSAFAVDELIEVNNYALAQNKKNPNAFSCQPQKLKSARFFSNIGEIDEAGSRAQEILEVVGEIEKLVSARTELRSQMNKLVAHKKQLLPYLPCRDKFSIFTDTKNTFSVLCYGKVTSSLEESIGEIAVTLPYPGAKSVNLVGIIALASDKEKVLSAVGELGLTVCPYTDDATAVELLRANEERINALLDENAKLVSRLLELFEHLKDIKKLHDYYLIEAEKVEAVNGFESTAKTFCAEGWVPSPSAEAVVTAVESAGGAVITLLEEVQETDDPPVLYKENKVLAPFQALTDQYSTPSYFEPDPNIFTAFFFFLFFGMMSADAGYGLVLALGATLMLKILKPEPGMKNLVMLIGICSISAIVWGVLFGSVFGFDFGHSDFGWGLFPTEEGYTMGVWFNPLEEPLLLLLICLVIGAVHIALGYAIGIYKNIKKGQVTDALFDNGFPLVTYVGVILLLLAMGKVLFNLDTHFWGNGGEIPLWPSAFENLLIPGLIIMGSGLLGSVLTKGRKKKGFGKVISGLSALYDIVNILSDVLSYARIFGITLASCAIGYAFNILIGMIGGGGGVMVVPAGILAIVLHAFNLAMGVLSAYVHNARLQYLEFYGKFYDGGGRTFRPLGGKTKYVRFI
ncbi:MAG: hypothetical protein IJX05_01415 [Clostridia bacterium]|nr:hypothetical protein [Clostridia bacterium]